MRLIRRCCSLFAVALALAVASPASAARMDIATPGKLVRLSDPEIAPDGKSVAVVVSRANFAENRFDAELVLVDVASKSQRVLTRGRRGVALPRWSPDGSQLAFLASVDGKAQVFVLPMAGGDALQVTKAATAVQTYAWRPDGRAFAYAAIDEEPKREGEERHNRSFEIANNDFLRNEAPRASHLWTVPLDGGAATRVTSGDWTLPIAFPPGAPPPPPSWSPDAKSIAVERRASRYSGDFDQSAVHVVEVASGQLRGLTGRARHESAPSFSPDGTLIAYGFPRGGETKNVNEIFVAPAGGGEGRSLTSGLDRHVLSADWMPDGRSLLLGANDGTSTGVWIQPLQGEARRLDFGRLVVASGFGSLSMSVSREGRLAFIASEAQRPAELYWTTAASGRPERLTDFNAEIAALELGRVETVEWDGPDGFRQDGVLTYPPGYVAGSRRPLVLYIHGGPRAASKQAFSTRAQLLAAQGYLVFEPNYRGSDNRGNAFMAAIWNDAGDGPGRDVMSGVETLQKRGIVDDSRIAVSGWSYGGYMTVWLLGRYPGVWRAAVAGAPVTDMMDQYGLGDANVRRGAAFGGSPYTDPKRLQAFAEQSPMTLAARIRTPTLILALTGDYRVPITQSYRLYHALRDNGVPVRFFGYPLPGHNPADPVHQRDVDRRWLEWLRAHLDTSP